MTITFVLMAIATAGMATRVVVLEHQMSKLRRAHKISGHVKITRQSGDSLIDVDLYR